MSYNPKNENPPFELLSGIPNKRGEMAAENTVYVPLEDPLGPSSCAFTIPHEDWEGEGAPKALLNTEDLQISYQ